MKLFKNTVSDSLWEGLICLMKIDAFLPFRLVGGTALSLQLGHRKSVDIDLFTDAEYGSINFNELESVLASTFPVFNSSDIEMVGMGKSYFIGYDKSDMVKLDLFYTDAFVFPIMQDGVLRMATQEEIAAMKMEVVSEGGRKKDFWDLHELLEIHSLNQIIHYYQKRYPYGASKEELLQKLVDFTNAEHDFTPVCFKQKEWELIKLDFEEYLSNP